jgi:N-hydroxyarylamine O-acetyltransferase
MTATFVMAANARRRHGERATTGATFRQVRGPDGNTAGLSEPPKSAPSLESVDDSLVNDYLARIGATRPARPDLAALRHLQERQVMTVPFENLDYHLGVPIHMDERVLDKIVHQRRGGGCYETNPALSYLLTALGFDVEILPGQVFRDRLGAPLCHLALRVTVAGERWLVDTGFGRNARLPLRFDSRDPQSDPHGEYQISDVNGGGIEVALNGRPLYRLDDRPCRIDDFKPTLWWWRTCPDSPFLQDLFCSLPTVDGRVTLKGDQLTVVTGTERVVENLADDAAILSAYKTHFGFGLDTVPRKPDVDSAGIEV